MSLRKSSAPTHTITNLSVPSSELVRRNDGTNTSLWARGAVSLTQGGCDGWEWKHRSQFEWVRHGTTGAFRLVTRLPSTEDEDEMNERNDGTDTRRHPPDSTRLSRAWTRRVGFNKARGRGSDSFPRLPNPIYSFHPHLPPRLFDNIVGKTFTQSGLILI